MASKYLLLHDPILRQVTTSFPLLPVPLGWRDNREQGHRQSPSGREPKDGKNSRQAASLSRLFGPRTGQHPVLVSLWVFLPYDNSVSET